MRQRIAQRSPQERHDTREEALYVDLRDGRWNRPVKKIIKEFAQAFLTDAVNDYSVPLHGNPDSTRNQAFRKCADCSEFPPPPLFRLLAATVADTPGAEGVECVSELKKIYTSNAGDNTIGVVDLRQMKVVKKLPNDRKPDGSAYAAPFHKLYVSDERGKVPQSRYHFLWRQHGSGQSHIPF